MVNGQDQDIIEAQSALQAQQVEAQRIATQRIPQRRFGVAVTRAQQQSIIQQRTQARSTIKQIQERKKEIIAIQRERDTARSQREAAIAARQEQERLIRIAKVERKISLRRFAERLPPLAPVPEELLFTPIPEEILFTPIPPTFTPIPIEQLQTLAAPEDLPGPVIEEPGRLEKITRSILPVFTGIKTGETRKPAGVKPTIEFLKAREEQLGRLAVKVQERIRPELKAQRIEAEKLDVEGKKLQVRIQAFNKKFGGKELTQEQLSQAQKESIALEQKQFELSERGAQLQTRVEAPTELGGIPRRIATGILTAPILIPSVGLGILTDPARVGEEVAIGIPKAFVQDPFGTGAELAGQAIFFGGAAALKGKIPRKALTRKERIAAIESLTSFDVGVGILRRPPTRPPRKPTPAEVPRARELAALRATLEAEKVQRVQTVTRGRVAALDFLREVERLEPRARAVQRARAATREQQRIDRAIQQRFIEQSTIKPRVIKSVAEIAAERAKAITKREQQSIEAQARARTAIQARLTAAEVGRRLGVLEPRRLATLRAKELTKAEKKVDTARQATRRRLALGELESDLASLKAFKAPKVAKRRAKELKERSELERLKRSREEKFLTDARTGTVLIQREKLRIIPPPKPKPVLKLVTPTITDLQRATLKKLKRRPSVRTLDVVRPDAIIALESLTRVKQKRVRGLSLRGELLQRELTESFRPRKRSRQLELQLQAQVDFSKQRQKQLNIFQKSRTKQRQKQILLSATKAKQAADQGFTQQQVFAQAEAQAFQQSFSTSQAQSFGIATIQAVNQATSFKEPAPLRTVSLLEELKAPILLRARPKKRVKKVRKKPEQAYNAFAKPEKKKRFVRLNKVPLTKTRAKDVMAFFVDRSLSASGKIMTTKGKPKPARLDVPKNFFSNREDKFREFRIKKGKKIPTPNKFIEKRGRRLDTPSEVKRISLLSLVSTTKRKKPKRKSIKMKGGLR